MCITTPIIAEEVENETIEMENLPCGDILYEGDDFIVNITYGLAHT